MTSLRKHILVRIKLLYYKSGVNCKDNKIFTVYHARHNLMLDTPQTNNAPITI